MTSTFLALTSALAELLAALRIIQRGDLPLRDLKGAYAGEIGQTQFLPSSYIKNGVDYDGCLQNA